MSINGMMRTSVSGMSAQSTRLGALAGNIANASTPGYKAAQAEFSSMLLDTPSTAYQSGGVETRMRFDVSRQGVIESTTSKFDLAISGNGFFVVEDRNGGISLTRAGSFVPDGEGQLVNAAGLRLLGLPANTGDAAAVVVNGAAGLEAVRLVRSSLEAVPTTGGQLAVNLPAGAAPVAGPDLPSANAVASQSSARSSIVAYGQLGEEVTLDVHYARTAITGEWEISVFDAAGRSATEGFPYAVAPLAQATLVFDGQGQLDASAASRISIPVPGGAMFELDLAGTTQLATDYSVQAVNTNGNPPSAVASLEISSDGTIYETYSNATRRAVYRIPVANVASPDNMIQKSGNLFQPTSASGDILVGAAGSSGLGSIISGALESSNVDLASELTDMIEAQRNYTANSRVFQTGSELMDVLVNLKR